MKPLRVLILILAATTITTGVAAAHPNHRVDRREARQDFRTWQGFRHGDLTRREVRRLRASRARIHRLERRSLADGRLGWRERRVLDRALDRRSRQIYRLRHNGRII